MATYLHINSIKQLHEDFVFKPFNIKGLTITFLRHVTLCLLTTSNIESYILFDSWSRESFFFDSTEISSIRSIQRLYDLHLTTKGFIIKSISSLLKATPPTPNQFILITHVIFIAFFLIINKLYKKPTGIFYGVNTLAN